MRGFHYLGETARELRRSRYLLLQLIRRDIRIRYKQAAMGFAWAIFMPLVVVLAGLVVRYVMAYLSNAPLDGQVIAGLMVKSLPWSFFVGAIGFATNSVVANHVLVTKVYFPREVLPIAAVVATGFDTLVGSIAVVFVLPLLAVQFSLTLFWVPLLVSLLFFFTVGCGMLLSCANAFFRDVKYLVQVMVTFGIFFTPVFFEPAMLGESVGRLMMLNPVAPILEGLRLSIIEGHNLATSLSDVAPGATPTVWEPWFLWYSALWAACVVGLGSVSLRRAQYLLAEYV